MSVDVWRSACLLALLTLCRCGGAVETSAPEAGPVVTPVVLATDSGTDETGPTDATTLDAGAFDGNIIAPIPDAAADGSPFPFLPADGGPPSLPVPVACDAGGYFVTIDDGANSVTLRSGCGDAGSLAVPSLQDFVTGNLTSFLDVRACSPGLLLDLQCTDDRSGLSPCEAGVCAPAYSMLDDGSLRGTGTIAFTSSPYTLAPGATIGGSYSLMYATYPAGSPVGSIAGTFCLYDTQ
jgi:hypothetical protein